MNWQDEGYLISKRKFRENAIIINVFTSKRGKVSGIVYGGNSRKIRNYLQISNKIFAIYNSKNENNIGYFKTELIEPYAPKYFDDKIKTATLLSFSSLLNSLLPDLQPHKKIYESLNVFFNSLKSENWLLTYVIWELNLIKELGYGIDLSMYTKKINVNSDFSNLKIDNTKYLVPNYLITNENKNKIFNNETIKKSLIFTRNLMLNKFFMPNNIIFPKSRILLENYFS